LIDATLWGGCVNDCSSTPSWYSSTLAMLPSLSPAITHQLLSRPTGDYRVGLGYSAIFSRSKLDDGSTDFFFSPHVFFRARDWVSDD
jgi:hypothetical protein